MTDNVRPFCPSRLPLHAHLPFIFSNHATQGPQTSNSSTVLPYPQFKLNEKLGMSTKQLESDANNSWLFSPTPVIQDLNSAETKPEFDAGTTELPPLITPSIR